MHAKISEVEIGEDSEGFSLGWWSSCAETHLVRWNTVCLEKRKGGLGVRNLFMMNIALLSKWNWRFANEREILWKQVISQKYGEEDEGWCSYKVSEIYGVGLWKAIRKK